MRAGTTAGALAALLLAPTWAEATVVRALSLFEKTQISTLVVRGTVEAVEATLEGPEKGRIETLVTFRVDEVLKGDARPGQRIMVRQAGGRVDDFEHLVPGVSTWKPGERAIMFLEALGPFLIEIGIGIGKYEIQEAMEGATVHHNPRVALARFDEEGAMHIDEPTPMHPERLEEFEKRVRSYARGLREPTPKGPSRRLERPVLPDPR